MKIFNYHPETKTFIGESEARPNPLEKGEFLIPAYATIVEPPSPKEGFARIFKDGVWSLTENSTAILPLSVITWDWVREQRTLLLLESDWTQLPDSPLTTEQTSAWRNYRTLLRDLPTDSGNAADVIFPEPPKV